jgi:glycosyltransferase involved in cell wall biosynthesis
MFEIMAAGRPVLLCGRGEAERVLCSGPDGPAGLVVHAEAPEELARAIETLSHDRALAAEMGCRGRRLVTTRFDRAAIAADLEKELEAIAR